MEQEVRIFCVISISSSSHVFIASILCSIFVMEALECLGVEPATASYIACSPTPATCS